MRIARGLLAVAVAVALGLPSVAMGQATVDVWVDPGHGGHDKGTLGYDSVRVEKNIALQVSAHLFARLGDLGYSVYLTRLSDYFVPLEDRAAMAS